MLTQLFHLVTCKPMTEAFLVQGIRLGKHPFVVDRVFARIVDTFHFERHPSAVAGRIVKKLHVVARTAERSDMFAMLMIVGIGSTLVDALHGHCSLQLVHLYFILDGTTVYYNEDLVQYPEVWAKIHAKLADYGFILRYLEGKEDITGYSYEPWHIRYIDDVALAKDITARGITLEEYLEENTSAFANL